MENTTSGGPVAELKFDGKPEDLTNWLNLVINNLGDLVVVTDTVGRITYVNPSFERITGYSSKEVLGKTTALLKSGNHSNFYYQTLWETISSGHIFKGNIINRKKNGLFYNEFKTIAPIKNEQGEIINYLSIGKDITNKFLADKEKDELLRMLNERVKEQTMLSLASNMFRANSEIPEGELFQKLASLLPSAFQEPESTWASVKIGNSLYSGSSYSTSANCLTHNFETSFGLKGGITVSIAPNASVKTNFLKEEEILLDSIVSILCNYLENQNSKKLALANEANLSALIENTSDLILSVDLNKQVLISNSACKEFFWKIFSSRIRAKSYIDKSLSGEALDFFNKGFAKSLNGEKMVEEFAFSGDAGAWIFEVSFSPIKDKDAGITGASVFAREITSRKNAESLLKESEVKYRSMIENLSDLISLLDKDGNFTFLSPSFEHILGYSPKEFVSVNVFKLIHPDDHRRVKQKLATILSTGENQTDIFRIKSKNGSWRWLEILFKNHLQTASINSLVVTGKDVTDRLAQKEQNEFQAHLLDQSAEAIIATDLQGKITFWNRFAEKLYLYSKTEVLGRDLLEALPVSSKKKTESFYNKIAKGESWSGEYQVKGRDGSYFYVHSNHSPIHDSKGNLIGTVGISFDINQRKRYEKILIFENYIFELSSRGISIDKILEIILVNTRKFSENKLSGTFLFTSEGGINLVKNRIGLAINLSDEFYGNRQDKDKTAGSEIFRKPLKFPINENHILAEKSRQILSGSGYRYMHTFPVIASNGKLTGLFLFYLENDGNLSNNDILLIERVQKIASILIEKDWAEKKIRNKQQQLKEISTSIPGLVFQFKVDRKGRPSFLFLSEGIYKLAGITAEEVYSDINTFIKLIHPDDLPDVEKSIFTSLENLSQLNGKFRILNPQSNSYKWIRGNSIPSRRGEFDTIWNGTMIDITNAELANEAILKSQEKYRSIVENAPDIIMQLDEEGVINSINFTIDGIDKEDVHGKKIQEFVSPQEGLIFKKLLNIVFCSGKTRIFENTFQSKEGPKHFLVRIGPIFEGEKVKAVTLIATDFTGLKMVQNEIKEKSIEYENLLSNLPDVVARFDNNLCYTFVNKAVERFVRVKMGDFIGRAIGDVNFPEIGQSTTEQEIMAVFKSGIKKNIEISYNAEGEEYHFLTTLVPENNAEGQVETVLAIFRDITKMKQVEAFLKHKNKELEKLNFELDRFVYSASHDLRSPLSSILGLLNLAKGENDLREISLYHQMMEESIHKLDDVVKEIIDYSKNARTNVAPEKINFHKLISDTLSFFKYSTEASKIKFETIVEVGEDFKTDAKRLKMVLNNLISNSVKYYDASKPQPRVTVLVQSTANMAIITVEDNGIGIEDAHLSNVFNMFYRATDTSKGTGLGLFIVKEIISKLRGEISLESALMVGTKVVIKIPSLEPEDMEKP